MKKLIPILICAVLFGAASFTQSAPPLPNRDAGLFLAGEHFPLILNGQGEIFGAAHPCTTIWVQTGYSPDADVSDNQNVAVFNPEVFTLGVKISCFSVGDSAKISEARFECAYDTTLSSFWNADSSNIFLEEGNFAHIDYGNWRFEALDDTSRRWLYPLKIMVGGYVRFIFASDIEDTCSVDWILTGEN